MRRSNTLCDCKQRRRLCFSQPSQTLHANGAALLDGVFYIFAAFSSCHACASVAGEPSTLLLATSEVRLLSSYVLQESSPDLLFSALSTASNITAAPQRAGSDVAPLVFNMTEVSPKQALARTQCRAPSTQLSQIESAIFREERRQLLPNLRNDRKQNRALDGIARFAERRHRASRNDLAKQHRSVNATFSNKAAHCARNTQKPANRTYSFWQLLRRTLLSACEKGL